MTPGAGHSSPSDATADLPLLAPFPGCATDCDLKKIECAQENQKQLFFLMFSRIVLGHNHWRSTSNNSTQAYILIPRHIRKDVLIRQIIASHLCTAIGGHQFRKESTKLQTRIVFERYYSFFTIACYLVFWCKNNSSKFFLTFLNI